jgi:hypothetical protein
MAAVIAAGGTARAQSAFEVCKGESKHVVTGEGQMSIAFIYPEDFPGRTTKQVLFPIGERLAVAEKAKVILVADVDKAVKLVGDKKWSDKAEACPAPPPIEAVLGQKHPNLSTAHVSEVCEGDKCKLVIDLERHGRASAERWVRYTAPIEGKKDDLKALAAAAPKLTASGPPPDAPNAGLAAAELVGGKVRARSDVDGSLEADRIFEASPEIAACGPKNRKAHDVRGYWAEWMLSAKGTAYQTFVHAFAGKDKADEEAADCLKRAIEKLQLSCPRDGKPVKVQTAICL